MPLKTDAPLEGALAACRSRGLRARLSPSAGRYLCNAAYAEALARAGGRPALFVHVPWPRGHHGPVPAARVAPWRPGADPLAAALAGIAAGLGRKARRSRMAQPPLA